jgi:hypothetical protein
MRTGGLKKTAHAQGRAADRAVRAGSHCWCQCSEGVRPLPVSSPALPYRTGHSTARRSAVVVAVLPYGLLPLAAKPQIEVSAPAERSLRTAEGPDKSRGLS